MRRVLGAMLLIVSILLYRNSNDVFRFDLAKSLAVDSHLPNAVSPPRRPPAGQQIVPLSYRQHPLRFLSTAPVDSLQLLPGIGPVLAERLVSARIGKSLFSQWEDLLGVKGIGPKKLQALKRLADDINPPSADRR